MNWFTSPVYTSTDTQGFSGSKARKSIMLLSTLPKYQTRCHQKK
jgi:hypothetical protein